jgi:ABC-type branched-subunit amino acid transport system substrate-binding protein
MLLGLSGCFNDNKIIPSGKKVYVSVLAPLSGDNKRYGRQSLLGLKIANKMKRYLSNGDEIIFDVVDTKSDAVHFANMIRSIDTNKTKIAVTFDGSNSLLEVQGELRELDIPVIATLATNDEITMLSKNMVQVCMSNKTEALVAAHYVKDEKFINNVGIVYNKKDKYSFELAKGFREIYYKLGGKIHFFDDLSNKKAFERFEKRDKSKVELIFSVVSAKLNVKLIKHLKEKKQHVEILGGDGLFNNALENEKENINLFNGVYVVEHYAHNDNYKSKNRDIVENHLYKYSLQESSYSFLAYDAYQLLYYAFDNCAEYNSKCLSEIIKNTDVINGIAGNFSIIDSKAKREVYIDKIENSKLMKVIVTY